MPNPIKYNTSTETLALKKGNFWIGTGDVGKGPTSSTGYYNGITPPSEGYAIYLNKVSGGPSIYTVTTEAQLTGLTSSIAGQTFTTSGQCLNWFATQTDKMIFNIDYPAIVTNGLVLNMDAAFAPSYPQSGTTWYSVGVSGNTGTLVNGPTYSDGSIVFDGTNDGVSITPTPTITSAFTFNMWVNKTQSKDSAAIIAIQGTLWQIDNNTIYWWSNVNFGPMSHSFTSTLNQWYNFCITQDNQTAKLYINSTLVRTTTMTDVSTTRGNNTIGCWGIGDRPWLGKISLTQIYNRVLTDSEIAQNYEAIGTRYTTLQVQSLVVAGGGSGGKRDTGGGGAGGLLTGTTTSLTTNTNYSIIVGAGAAAPTLSGSNNIADSQAGLQGSLSNFNSVTAIGGGGGGKSGVNGGNGGSGGGGSWASNPGAGTTGQGFSGGSGTLYSYAGGGGGGAGEFGGDVGAPKYGSGGTGVYISEYVSLGGSPSGWFAGGGGGSLGNNDSNYNSPGGKGGGGTGGRLGNPTPINGTVNTGGGGGAQGDYAISTGPAGNGGSGIVILRIPDVYTANFSSGVTSSMTKSGGYKYYKVTATSTTSETVRFS
jgi:hypothetical protein